MDNLMYNTRLKILKIEKSDLHRQLIDIKSKIEEVGRRLSDLLPVYLWKHFFDSIDRWFEEYKIRGYIKNNKKIQWLEKKKNERNLSKIKNINFLVQFDNNKKRICL